MKQWKSLQLTEFNGLDIKTSPINLPMNLSPYLKNVSLDTYGDITGRKPYKYYQSADTFDRITAMERYYTKDGGKHLIVVGILTGESELKVYAYPYDGERKVIYEPVYSTDGFFTFATWRDNIYFSSLEDGIRYWNPKMTWSESVYPTGEEAEDGQFEQKTIAQPLSLVHQSTVTLQNNIDTSGTPVSSGDVIFDSGGINIYGVATGLSGLAGYGNRFYTNRQGDTQTDLMAVFFGSLSSGSVEGVIYGETGQGAFAFLKAAHDIEYSPENHRLWQVQKTETTNPLAKNNRKRRWVEIDIDELGNKWFLDIGEGYTWFGGSRGGAMGQVFFDKQKLVATHTENNKFYPMNWTLGNDVPDGWLSAPPYGSTESHWLYACWDNQTKVIWALASDSHWSFEATKIVMVSRTNEEIYELPLPNLQGQARGLMWSMQGHKPHLHILVRRGVNDYRILSYKISGGTVDEEPGWRTSWYGGYGLANWFGTEDESFKVMASHEEDLRSMVVAEEPDKQQNIELTSDFKIQRLTEDTHFGNKGIALIARENNGNSFGLLYNLGQSQLEIIQTYQGHQGIEYNTLESINIPSGIVDHIAEGHSFRMNLSIKDDELKGKIMPGEYHWVFPEAKVETTSDELARPGYCGVAVFGGNFKASFKDIWGTYEPVVTETTIAQGKYIALHNNRLFVANTKFGEGEDESRNPSDIRYSELGKHDQWYRDVEGALIPNTINVASQDGDEITGLVPIMGELYVLKGNSIWILYGTGPHNFQLKEILPSMGCIAPRTLATYQNKVVFLSHAGIVMMDEGGIQIISDPVAPALEQIKEENLKYCVGGMKGNQYWFSFQKEEDLPEPVIPTPPTHIQVRFSAKGGMTVTMEGETENIETIDIRFSTKTGGFTVDIEKAT